MASVASQLIEEVTAHLQRDSLEDAREICADGTYFLNNLRNNYEYNKHNLICRSGYRFTAQHHTKVNINKTTTQGTEFKKYT